MSIKSQLRIIPIYTVQLANGLSPTAIFHAWVKLPISLEEFYAEQRALQAAIFPSSAPLPGAVQLLSDLSHATTITSNNPVHIALATSSHAANFKLKTAHLTDLFTVFTPTRRVLGDDPRIPPGRGKPHPDIYLLALQTINSSLSEGEKPITPEECLVFEDSVPGVESGRRAGMRVVWVPHEGLKAEYTGREAEVLAGLTGEAEGELDLLGKVGDGWGDQMATLERFPYEKYGIKVEEKQ